MVFYLFIFKELSVWQNLKSILKIIGSAIWMCIW